MADLDEIEQREEEEILYPDNDTLTQSLLRLPPNLVRETLLEVGFNAEDIGDDLADNVQKVATEVEHMGIECMVNKLVNETVEQSWDRILAQMTESEGLAQEELEKSQKRNVRIYLENYIKKLGLTQYLAQQNYDDLAQYADDMLFEVDDEQSQEEDIRDMILNEVELLGAECLLGFLNMPKLREYFFVLFDGTIAPIRINKADIITEIVRKIFKPDTYTAEVGEGEEGDGTEENNTDHIGAENHIITNGHANGRPKSSKLLISNYNVIVNDLKRSGGVSEDEGDDPVVTRREQHSTLTTRSSGESVETVETTVETTSHNHHHHHTDTSSNTDELNDLYEKDLRAFLERYKLEHHDSRKALQNRVVRHLNYDKQPADKLNESTINHAIQFNAPPTPERDNSDDDSTSSISTKPSFDLETYRRKRLARELDENTDNTGTEEGHERQAKRRR